MQEKLEVRYVLAPKQRVIYDIVNETHNITLPVVAVNVTSVTRDDTRVFNKIDGFYIPAQYRSDGKITSKIPTPLPVNISVSMSIITKYQIDMDQIISNFAPYNNPYIILTWKIPSEANTAYDIEIRSEVLWDGTISFTLPTELNAGDKYRISADTTFTIKGWLFKKLGETSKNIFVIDSNFYNLRKNTNLLYNSLSGMTFVPVNTASVQNYNFTETVSISAIPEITNVFVSATGVKLEIFDNQTISRNVSGYAIALYGKNFDLVNNVLLSSSNPTFLSPITSVSFYKMPSVSGVLVDLSNYEVITKNVMVVNIPYTANNGIYDIILAGSVGYDTTLKSKNIVFNLT